MGEDGKVYHVDLANQIGNTWSGNSVLGITREGFRCSILLPSSMKKEFYRRFIEPLAKDTDNKKVKHSRNWLSAVLYAYMLHRLLVSNAEILSGHNVSLCRDCKPEKPFFLCISKSMPTMVCAIY